MSWKLPTFTIRTFAVITAAITSGYVMWLGNKINDTLSGPGWCATALGAGKASSTDGAPIKGLEACVSLLTIQLKSLSTNSHILLGTIALCVGTLVIIVLAGAKFSGNVDEHGASVNLQPAPPPTPVVVTNPPEEPVPTTSADTSKGDNE